ncbi:MAG: hypothetical protein RIS94_1728 [Pseudomonadota bacterium]|jgi:heat shock protein HslJ
MHGMKVAFALPLLAALTACATPASHGGGLAHTRWQIVSIDGQPASAPGRARLAFDDARLFASAGCNGLGSDYRIDGDRLIVGPVISTQMYCEGLMDQERALATLFASAPQITRNAGNLRIASAGHTLEAKAAER